MMKKIQVFDEVRRWKRQKNSTVEAIPKTTAKECAVKVLRKEFVAGAAIVVAVGASFLAVFAMRECFFLPRRKTRKNACACDEQNSRSRSSLELGVAMYT